MKQVAERETRMVPEQVRALESVMRQMPGSTNMADFTSHHFCAGMYVRELFLPAGTTAIGKTHAQQNVFLLVKGELTMATPEGPVRVRAPFMAITQPGDKRAVYAHEDSVCMNFHPNPDDERDLEVLEGRYIIPEALPAPDAKELLE